VIERRPNQYGRGSTYHLTRSGRELTSVVDALGSWGQRWLELDRGHLDVEQLMWRLFKELDPAALPERPVVLRFEFRGSRQPWWLVLRRGDPDLCAHDPGLPTDLTISADLEVVVRVYLGEIGWRDALKSRLVQVEGQATLARQLATWIGRSVYAPSARPRRYDPATRAFLTSR
jgi:SCP-2 sterol transfer family protein